MRAVVALMLSASILTPGCFPHDSHKRTLAQLIEGGTIAAGIGVEAFVSTGADCDMMTMQGLPIDMNCHNRSSTWGGLGVALILGGLLGFIATISTAEDDKPEAPPHRHQGQAPDHRSRDHDRAADDHDRPNRDRPGPSAATTNVAAPVAPTPPAPTAPQTRRRQRPRPAPVVLDRSALAADDPTLAFADLAAVVDGHVARPGVARAAAGQAQEVRLAADEQVEPIAIDMTARVVGNDATRRGLRIPAPHGARPGIVRPSSSGT